MRTQTSYKCDVHVNAFLRAAVECEVEQRRPGVYLRLRRRVVGESKSPLAGGGGLGDHVLLTVRAARSRVQGHITF